MCRNVTVNDRRWKDSVFYRGFLPQSYLTVNDEFCRSLILKCPSVVLSRVTTPYIWGTSSPLGPAAWSLGSKERLVLFFPHLWCHALPRTYMCLSVAGRAAHMHFTSPTVILGFTGPCTIWNHTEVWLRLDFSSHAPVNWREYLQNTSYL